MLNLKSFLAFTVFSFFASRTRCDLFTTIIVGLSVIVDERRAKCLLNDSAACRADAICMWLSEELSRFSIK
jgi:hypothetical protein